MRDFERRDKVSKGDVRTLFERSKDCWEKEENIKLVYLIDIKINGLLFLVRFKWFVDRLDDDVLKVLFEEWKWGNMFK